jgi:hypothetical protein
LASLRLAEDHDARRFPPIFRPILGCQDDDSRSPLWVKPGSLPRSRECLLLEAKQTKSGQKRTWPPRRVRDDLGHRLGPPALMCMRRHPARNTRRYLLRGKSGIVTTWAGSGGLVLSVGGLAAHRGQSRPLLTSYFSSAHTFLNNPQISWHFGFRPPVRISRLRARMGAIGGRSVGLTVIPPGGHQFPQPGRLPTDRNHLRARCHIKIPTRNFF